MKRILKGCVVSDKMDKTVVVQVSRVTRHPIYHKDVMTRKKYVAHDAENFYKKGAVVLISESRPFSKTKTWEVLGFADGGIA